MSKGGSYTWEESPDVRRGQAVRLGMGRCRPSQCHCETVRMPGKEEDLTVPVGVMTRGHSSTKATVAIGFTFWW